MSDKTGIEWTDATWNPLTGCTKVSPGCDHCYAKTMHERFNGPGSFDKVELKPERLDQPLRWRKPRRVFVNSMSDLFHESVPDDYIAEVFAVMSLAPQHTFQLLTKRHGRMRSVLSRHDFDLQVRQIARDMKYGDGTSNPRMDDRNYATWPLPNVWLGVSVEDQKWADIRIPALLGTPAAVRFLSCEPLLGSLNLRPFFEPYALPTDAGWSEQRSIDWVIVGGESGREARPMHPDWARSIRNDCRSAGVPFLFKQWGEFLATKTWPWVDHAEYKRVGKKAAGREIDGRTWDEYPDVVA